MMESDFRISGKNQSLDIFPLGDIHVGSPQFNEELFELWIKTFKEDKNQKIIYMMGDEIDLATKRLGNSAYKQDMAPNDQIDYVVKNLKPFKKYIRGIVNSNHLARASKEFDLNLPRIIATALDVPFKNNIYDKLIINDTKEFSVYATHGSKNSTQNHLMLGAVQRQLAHIHCDLGLYGHTHKLGTITDYSVDHEGYKRKTFVLTGSFLDFEDSYAEEMCLKPQPAGFSIISVDKFLKPNVDFITSIDLERSRYYD